MYVCTGYIKMVGADSICHYGVGTSHKSTSGPLQGPQQHLHWPNSGPFQGSADNPREQLSGPFQGPNQTASQSYQLPFLGPRTTESVYSGQSEVSLFQPITSRFILTNHRHTNPANRIKGDRLG